MRAHRFALPVLVLAALVAQTWCARPPGGSGPCDGGAAVTAEATTYDALGGLGNCSVALDFDNYAAVSDSVWSGSQVCGACLEVTGPAGTTTVIAADRCPGCPASDLDLSPSTYAAVADAGPGRVEVTWRVVPCPVTGNVELIVQAGSNDYYLSVSVWNARYAIAGVEVQPSGAPGFSAMTRTTYGTFTHTGGLIVFPVTLRATDVHGHSTTAEIASSAPGTTPAAGQLGGTCP